LDWAALGSEELLYAILAHGGAAAPQPPWIRQCVVATHAGQWPIRVVPMFQKKCCYEIHVSQTSLSLTRTIVNTINIYVSRLVYYKILFYN
jgi:hypothetical protein